MRIAALYDIHGNLPALEAALADVDRFAVDLVVFGGDLCWGPLPRETLEMCLDVTNARFVRGNADREVASGAGVNDGLEPVVAEVNEWCHQQLTPEQRTFLMEQDETLSEKVDGLGSVLFCHGSPRNDEETITAKTPDVRVLQMLESVTQGVVVCGHTHAAFDRVVGSTRVVNAGSVGLPFGDPGAYWALLGPDVTLMKTEYDYEGAGALFRAKGGPTAGEFAEHALSPPPASAQPWD